MKKILILNGSPHGKSGNSNRLVQKIRKVLTGRMQAEVIHLSENQSDKTLRKSLEKADGFIFVTGTYWDSWGSPLQKFLEDMTDLEGSPVFVGKPCAVFVLMHSVGGKSVLSRLQGVLSTFGLLIPPMSGMVYSLVSDLVLKNLKTAHKEDLWSLSDIEMILNNLELSLDICVKWKAWPVDRKNFRRNWIK